MLVCHKALRFSFAVLVIFLDQLSKIVILNWLSFKDVIGVTSFFNLTLTFNRGVSFGFFPADTFWGKLVLILIAITFVTWLIFCLWKAEDLTTQIGYSFIIGGALGNLIDRFQYGAVVDFLQFHLYNHFFPVFNIADSAITVGVILIFLQQAWHVEKKKEGQGII
ncbi:MAG: signal peptidase II [Alphaproteobacteria bacterium]|nr:signal peptidase II [Alphaproteobacteria bacterium]